MTHSEYGRSWNNKGYKRWNKFQKYRNDHFIIPEQLETPTSIEPQFFTTNEMKTTTAIQSSMADYTPTKLLQMYFQGLQEGKYQLLPANGTGTLYPLLSAEAQKALPEFDLKNNAVLKGLLYEAGILTLQIQQEESKKRAGRVIYHTLYNVNHQSFEQKMLAENISISSELIQVKHDFHHVLTIKSKVNHAETGPSQPDCKRSRCVSGENINDDECHDRNVEIITNAFKAAAEKFLKYRKRMTGKARHGGATVSTNSTSTKKDMKKEAETQNTLKDRKRSTSQLDAQECVFSVENACATAIESTAAPGSKVETGKNQMSSSDANPVSNLYVDLQSIPASASSLIPALISPLKDLDINMALAPSISSTSPKEGNQVPLTPSAMSTNASAYNSTLQFSVPISPDEDLKTRILKKVADDQHSTLRMLKKLVE